MGWDKAQKIGNFIYQDEESILEIKAMVEMMIIMPCRGMYRFRNRNDTSMVLKGPFTNFELAHSTQIDFTKASVRLNFSEEETANLRTLIQEHYYRPELS